MGKNDLGSCCICQKKGADVVNVLCLEYYAPVHGYGWGCFVCNKPNDGAIAVVCDKCFTDFQNKKAEIKFVCIGYPYQDKRLPIEQLDKTPFKHDKRFHPKGGDY